MVYVYQVHFPPACSYVGYRAVQWLRQFIADPSTRVPDSISSHQIWIYGGQIDTATDFSPSNILLFPSSSFQQCSMHSIYLPLTLSKGRKFQCLHSASVFHKRTLNTRLGFKRKSLILMERETEVVLMGRL
jgi:hypothetical protein